MSDSNDPIEPAPNEFGGQEGADVIPRSTNQFDGDATGPVFQIGSVQGGISFDSRDGRQGESSDLSSDLNRSESDAERRVAIIVAIIGAVAIVLAATIAAAAAYLSHKSQDRPESKSPISTSGPPSPAQSSPGAAESTEPAPKWPGDPDGVQFITGSPELDMANGNSLDLDDNDVVWDMHATREFDLIGSDHGLGAQNGAGFASFKGQGLPSLRDCRAKAESDWILQVGVEQFKAPTIFCVRTNEGRVGYLKTGSVKFRDQRKGQVDYFYLSFVLWKKPEDK